MMARSLQTDSLFFNSKNLVSDILRYIQHFKCGISNIKILSGHLQPHIFEKRVCSSGQSLFVLSYQTTVSSFELQAQSLYNSPCLIVQICPMFMLINLFSIGMEDLTIPLTSALVNQGRLVSGRQVSEQNGEFQEIENS